MELKITKDDILEKITPDNLHITDLASSAGKKLRKLRREHKKADLRTAGIIVAGAALTVSVASLAGHYIFYRCVVSREMKKQLAPMATDLNLLRDENKKLSEEIEQLKAQKAPAVEETPAEAPADAE